MLANKNKKSRMIKYHSILKLILLMILAVTLVPIPLSAHASVSIKVKTVAGKGDFGFCDTAADQAVFSYPYGLAADKDGGLIIVDSYNNRIRLLKNNQVTTIAGSSEGKDADGLPITGFVDGELLKCSFNHPRGVAVDSKGNIFVSDTGNNCIRILTGGRSYTFAGNATAGYCDSKGKKAQFNLPSGMAIDSNDNLYVADTLNNVIRQISPEGVVTTFAGTYSEDGGCKDGAAETAEFNEPSDVAVDSKGIVYVLDSGNQLVRKIQNGVVSTIAGTYAEKIANTSYVQGGFQNGSTNKAMFNFPLGIDVTENGTIFIADTWNHRIRVIKTDGSVGTLAGNGNPGWSDGYADEAQFNGPVDVLYHNGILYISDMWNNCIRSVPVNVDKVATVVDRSELEQSYTFDKAAEDIQVWYDGSRIKLTNAKAYKEQNIIYLPLENVMKTWGADVRWIKKNKKLEVTYKNFDKTFKPGTDMTFMKDGHVYIDTESLSKLTNLRIDWFPEYNALVMEKR